MNQKKQKNQFKKSFQWILKHSITVFSCVLIVALGIVVLTHANSNTTTIGENISAGGNLIVGGNATTTGSHYIGSDLSILGNASTTGAFTLSGIANFLSDLIVGGNATTTGNLVVSGDTNLATTTMATTTISALSSINNNIKYVKLGETIQSVIDGITDASESNPYTLIISPGINLTEIPILPDYISLHYIKNQWEDSVGTIWESKYNPATIQCNHDIVDLGGGRLLVGHGAVGWVSVSEDYGETWTLQGQISDYLRVYKFLYLGDDRVIAFSGSAGKIAVSTNAGATWTDLGIQGNGDIERIRDAVQCDNGVLLAVGTMLGGADGLRVLRSTEAGATWTSIQVHSFKMNAYTIIYCGRGVALMGTVNRFGSPGHIYKTTDYGLNWTMLDSNFPNGVAKLLDIGGGTIWLGTGQEGSHDFIGKIFISKDFGATFEEKQTLGTEGASGLFYIGDGIGFAGTSIGAKIHKTVDYGEHWHQVFSDPTFIRIKTFLHLGNGIILAAGCGDMGASHILKSTPY